MKTKIIILGILVLITTGCSTTGGPDPYEGFNRGVMKFNDGADKRILKPITRGYRAVTPDIVETGVGNFFSNLNEPVVALNQLLQGKPGLALNDVGRFLINSTIGIGGIIEVADSVGLEKHQEDFGQTFGVWGIEQGPYLVLPFWGPSNPRDAIGDFIGAYGFAPRYLDEVRARNILYGLSIINRRASLLDAEELVTGDRYLFIRDAYLQRRNYLTLDGVVEDEFLD